MGPIQHIVVLVLLTGYLENVRPLSLIVIAKKESAKTEVVATFSRSDEVLYLNNFTPTAFMDEYIREFMNHKYHHLIIPDLLSCISRQKYLVDTTITFLNSFTEEGIKEIISKAYDQKIKLPEPVRGGLITTIAKEDFEARWKKWSSVGFLTRFLPVSYQYGQDLVDEILQACATQDEEHVLGKPYSIKLPSVLKSKGGYRRTAKVSIGDDLAHQLIKPGKNMQKHLSTYGFRGVRHLRRLVQAEALFNNRTTVTQEDINKVLELSKFCNLDYTVIGKQAPPKFASDFQVGA